MVETNWMIGNARRWGVDRLKNSGVDTPDLDAEVILMHSLRVDRHELYRLSGDMLKVNERELYKRSIERRSKREPVAYITGHKEFRSLDFHVTNDVLVPRPETEILVDETVTECVKKKGKRHVLRILELGTGSGVVAVSLAMEIKPIALIATDISFDIVNVARNNARLHNVNHHISFFVGRYVQGINQEQNCFDCIVSNPPYLSKSDWEGAQPEIREHEPMDSLLGGEDGMDFYRTIIPDASRLLSEDGCLLLEVGMGQAELISGMIKETGHYAGVTMIQDLSGINRVVKAQK